MVLVFYAYFGLLMLTLAHWSALTRDASTIGKAGIYAGVAGLAVLSVTCMVSIWSMQWRFWSILFERGHPNPVLRILKALVAVLAMAITINVPTFLVTLAVEATVSSMPVPG